MRWHFSALSRLNVSHGGKNRIMRRVGFWRCGKKDSRICQGYRRFGHTKLACRVAASLCYRRRHRIRKSHVLAGYHLKPSAHRQKLSERKELRKIKGCGVGIRASDGLLDNIPGCEVTFANLLNVYDVVNATKLVVDKAALAKIEEVFA